MWRPLFGPLEDYPLAVCDSRTVEDDDLVAMDVVYPTYVVEMYAVKNNEKHRWFFLDKQRFDEVLVLTNFDSANNKCEPYFSSILYQ